MVYYLIYLSMWLSLGLISTGLLNNYYKNQMPWFYRKTNFATKILWMFCGPVGFYIHLLNIKLDNHSNSYLPKRNFLYYGWSLK